MKSFKIKLHVHYIHPSLNDTLVSVAHRSINSS